ncbi:MAG: tetratricopeptide repeat protein [Candidatus Hydrogenedens sp.]|nr:tetratricopeptide repeat protein [Candidatus Hydrogenedens sp.]
MAEVKPQIRCRHCNKMADPDKVPGEGDIICMQCGLNLLTGQKIQRPQGAMMAEEARTRFKPVWIIVPVALVALGLLGGVVYFLSQDPVGQARQLAREQNVIEAKHVLETYLPAHPENAEAHVLYGQLQCRSEDFSGALDTFLAALNADPANAEAAQLALLAASRLGNVSNAAQRKADAYRRIVQAQPGNTQALRLLAVTEGAAGNYAALTESLDAVAERDGESAAVLNLKGAGLALQGDTEAAKQVFKDAEALDPADPIANLALGLVASMEGDEAQALQDLRAAKGAGPQMTALVNARVGMIQMSQGNYEAALPLLRSAMDGGANAEAEFFHAVCLKELRLTQEALEALQRIAQGQTKYAGRAAVEAAQMYLAGRRIEEAEAMARNATAAGENSAKLYTIQGQLYVARGEENEGQQSFRRAIQTDPQYAPAHLESGLLYVKQGITQQGLESLERYIELASTLPGARTAEVEVLIAQLKQTMESGASAPARL